jgi:two-component sensor histidine kinase
LPARVRELGEARDPSAHLEVQPIGVHSTDEIGQVARAFDLVHTEAVRLAGNEAILRHNVSEMFVSLSRRSQSLIERLGQMMQSAGEHEQDPMLRSEFSMMEHLVIRMRRNSENLLVLAGYEAVRRWSGSVSLEELVQAAVSEIEQHTRVDLDIRPGILVAGQAATDVVHLLAELIENATKFSPRETRVRVSGYEVSSGGVLVEIDDSGVGISAGRLADMNQRLDNPPVADVSVSRHMGLFAVSHLAARHGVRVRLRAAPTEGLTALVWLPDAITGRGSGQEELAPGSWQADVYAQLPVPAFGMPLVPASGVLPVPAFEMAPPLADDDGLRVGGYLPAGSQTAVPVAPVAPAVAAVPAVPVAPAAVATAGDSLTASGLPLRVPQASGVSGSVDAEENQAPQPLLLSAPPAPRSADAARARLGGLQRGTRRAEQQIARADEERADH